MNTQRICIAMVKQKFSMPKIFELYCILVLFQCITPKETLYKIHIFHKKIYKINIY